jgi:hypothetical protein
MKGIMPRQNLHTGVLAVSSRHKTVTHLVLTSRRKDFPAGTLGIVSPVTDLNISNPSFGFTASVISSTTKRAHIQLIAINPAGGSIIPTDGILSLTLFDNSTASPPPIPVADIPVEYVDDPTAPTIP